MFNCRKCGREWYFDDGNAVDYCPHCGDHRTGTPPTSKTVQSMNLNFELLIKLMRLSESSNDNEALAALRKANEHIKKLKWDWEKLLRGKIMVAADPFASAPDLNIHRPANPPPPPPPPPPYTPYVRPANSPAYTRPKPKPRAKPKLRPGFTGHLDPLDML